MENPHIHLNTDLLGIFDESQTVRSSFVHRFQFADCILLSVHDRSNAIIIGPSTGLHILHVQLQTFQTLALIQLYQHPVGGLVFGYLLVPAHTVGNQIACGALEDEEWILWWSCGTKIKIN